MQTSKNKNRKPQLSQILHAPNICETVNPSTTCRGIKTCNNNIPLDNQKAGTWKVNGIINF